MRRVLIFLLALLVMLLRWVEKVKEVSNVSPKIVGVLCSGIGELFRVTVGWILVSWVSVVIRVTEDFSDEAVI